MLELILLLLFGMPATRDAPKVDLGNPPTFTAAQVKAAAAAAQPSHDRGCEASVATSGRVLWRYLPKTCANGRPGDALDGQGTPGVDMDTLLALHYTELEPAVQRATTTLPTYVCTQHCDYYDSRAVVYRLEAGFLLGTISERAVDAADWESWLAGIAFDLDA